MSIVKFNIQPSKYIDLNYENFDNWNWEYDKFSIWKHNVKYKFILFLLVL